MYISHYVPEVTVDMEAKKVFMGRRFFKFSDFGIDFPTHTIKINGDVYTMSHINRDLDDADVVESFEYTAPGQTRIEVSY